MEKLNLLFEKGKKTFYVSLVLLVIGVIFVCIGMVLNKTINDNKKDPVSYTELIKNGQEKENMYATIDIVFLQSFYYDSNYIYFYASDKSNNFYITSMKQSTYNRISDQFMKDEKNFSYTITGFIYDIPEKVVNAAIENVKELNTINHNLNRMDKKNYSNFIGTTYISEDEVPKTIGTFITFIGVIILIISVILMYLYVSTLINKSKTLKKYSLENILFELNKKDTISFDRLNVHVSSNYIITALNGLTVIPLKDIKHAYIVDNKYGPIHSSYQLYVITKSNKKIEIINSRKHVQDIKLLLMEIYNKNKNIKI